MRMHERKKQATLEFAQKLTDWGFKVYIAESGTYGFVTDESGKRVLSFQDIGSSFEALGGNYGPPSVQSGTGWRMDEVPSDLDSAEKVKATLNALPPAFAGTGWKKLSTIEDHMKDYQSSSRYKLYEPTEQQ